jgi:glucose dehydrogenase
MFSSLFALLAVASVVWLIWMVGSDLKWWDVLKRDG